MRMRRYFFGWAALALAGFLAAGCVSTHRAELEQGSASANAALAAGEYEKAMASYRDLVFKNPKDEKLKSEYRETVEAVKQSADRAYLQKNYARAGRVYGVLVANFSDFSVAGRLSFTRLALEKKLKECRTALGAVQYEQEMRSGNYERALGICQALAKDYPGDVELASACVRAENEVKAAGDKARAEADFSRAGIIYAMLLRNYGSFKSLPPRVTFSQADLAKSMAGCRDVLTKKGLAEYRKGNLTAAIAVWESLLSFDPDNAEIKKAVETARAQAGKLIKK